MAKLGVREKYLKKLRDNGYLGYSREGDKYWYTQEDVDRFLRRFHYEAIAVGDELPKQEGGSYVRYSSFDQHASFGSGKYSGNRSSIGCLSGQNTGDYPQPFQIRKF